MNDDEIELMSQRTKRFIQQTDYKIDDFTYYCLRVFDRHCITTIITSGYVGVERLALIIAKSQLFKTEGVCSYETRHAIGDIFGLRYRLYDRKDAITRVNIDSADAVVAFVRFTSIDHLHFIGYALTGRWELLSKEEIVFTLDTPGVSRYKPLCLIHPEQFKHFYPEHGICGFSLFLSDTAKFLKGGSFKRVFITGHHGDDRWFRDIAEFLSKML